MSLIHSRKLKAGSKCHPSCCFISVLVYEWRKVTSYSIMRGTFQLPTYHQSRQEVL